MVRKKRIAVIGAGLSGAAAMRTILEEKMEPVCFERTAYYGGLWRYHDEDVEGLASVMKTTMMNSCKEVGCISDFVPPMDLPPYLSHKDVIKFLEQMMKERDLYKYIRYSKEVVQVKFAQDYGETGRYDVSVKDTVTGNFKTGTFDGVFVCTGHHVYPNWPAFPGQDKFKGRIIHTHSLKSAVGYEDKNVLIVGTGNSAADAAAEISNLAKQVYMSTRRGAWIASRMGPGGMPSDFYFNTRIFFYLKQFLPHCFFNRFLEAYINFRFDHSFFGLKPDHNFMNQHPTVCDGLPIKVLAGRVVIKPNIQRFTEDGVIFMGDTEVTPVDEVVFGTGYIIKFPFLGEEITKVEDNKVHLYKFIYPPHLPHPSLAIIGLVQPLGAGFPVGDAQCRLAAYAASDRVKLPSREAMEADIARYKEIYKRSFVQSSRHTIECDFVSYLDELNELFGARPNLLKLFFRDPKLWWSLIFGPHLAYQYRLQGPHTWPGARDAIFASNKRIRKPLNAINIKNKSCGNKPKTGQKLLFKRVLISKLLLLFPLLWFILGSALNSEAISYTKKEFN